MAIDTGTGALLAALGASVLTYFGVRRTSGTAERVGNRTAEASENNVIANLESAQKTALLTAQTTERGKTLDMLSLQLERVQTHSDTLEANFREEMKEITKEIKELRAENKDLTLRLTKTENDHLHEKRKWDRESSLQEDRINFLTLDNAKKDERIAALIRLLDQYGGDKWRNEEKELIGDSEGGFKDRFTDRLIHSGTRIEHTQSVVEANEEK